MMIYSIIHYIPNQYTKHPVSTEQRFWSKVQKPIGEGCWLWTGWKNYRGYGGITINKKCIRTHRYSWQLHNGIIPQNMNVCHKCDNPPCVNPSHLFLGTNKDNISDCIKKGRKPITDTKGIKHWYHKFTNDQIKYIRNYPIYRGSGRELAEMFNVSRECVYAIRKNRNWKHIV